MGPSNWVGAIKLFKYRRWNAIHSNKWADRIIFMVFGTLGCDVVLKILDVAVLDVLCSFWEFGGQS